MLSKILKTAGNIFIGITVFICLIFSVFTIPRFFGVTPFVVQSSSMEPEIPTGSVVFTNTNDKDVETGDIITYSLSTGEDTGVFITHRVHDTNAEKGLIQTKGDANDNADGWLEKEAVMGTVMFHIPEAGFLLEHLQEKGFVLLAIWVFTINALLLILPYILDIAKDNRMSKKFKVRVSSRAENLNKNKKGKGDENEE